jgi:hypothetical protein
MYSVVGLTSLIGWPEMPMDKSGGPDFTLFFFFWGGGCLFFHFCLFLQLVHFQGKRLPDVQLVVFKSPLPTFIL